MIIFIACLIAILVMIKINDDIEIKNRRDYAIRVNERKNVDREILAKMGVFV